MEESEIISEKRNNESPTPVSQQKNGGKGEGKRRGTLYFESERVQVSDFPKAFAKTRSDWFTPVNQSDLEIEM